MALVGLGVLTAFVLYSQNQKLRRDVERISALIPESEKARSPFYPEAKFSAEDAARIAQKSASQHERQAEARRKMMSRDSGHEEERKTERKTERKKEAGKRGDSDNEYHIELNREEQAAAVWRIHKSK